MDTAQGISKRGYKLAWIVFHQSDKLPQRIEMLGLPAQPTN
jgi:hypothetical protein